MSLCFERREVQMGLLMIIIFCGVYVSFFRPIGFSSAVDSSLATKNNKQIAQIYSANQRLLRVIKSQQDVLLELKQSLFSVDENVKSQKGNRETILTNMESKIDRVLDTMDSMLVPKKNNTKTATPPTMRKEQKEEIKRVVVQEEDENYRHIRVKELDQLKLELEEVVPLDKPSSDEMHDKWIVVTSIFKPSEDIKKLASIPGWKLVVVGDKKTPKDWKVPGVVFLSIEDQKKLGYETVKYLKYGVYQRKNMGFLYAIHHGAKYIYDTDDDNHPYGGKITFDEKTEDKTYLMYHGNQHYYNTFAHFGQSTLWPRGYPLDMIDKHPVRTYKKCKKVRPLVQQGVVDGDPDLDAIQRLTRKDTDAKFVVYFDITAPPVVLPPNSFTPYNTQNTFHHYDAFFSLLCPQTVTFRVNDIWRSFITQRLLWDIGGHLAYYAPNAYQDRTPHNFLTDFYEEKDLYWNTNPLTQYLLKWNSKKTNMLERHYEVIKGLYREDLLGALDVRLARAWVRDLKRIGYKPPEMQNSTAVCEENTVKFEPKEMPTLFNRIGQKTVNVYDIAKKYPLTKERERDEEIEKKLNNAVDEW